MKPFVPPARVFFIAIAVTSLCFVSPPIWSAPTPTTITPERPLRAPFFGGESLPDPPQQNAPWPHGTDALSIAAATLFEQGLADPRGLEYREIEIAVGNPWNGGGYPIKTHGWVFPEEGRAGRLAVAWNGLVYPVVRVGNVADVRKDWATDPKKSSVRGWNFGGASEASSVDFVWPSRIKMVLLLRLGETELVQRISKNIQPQNADPYLDLARDWTWNAFERAVCAHERGDDRLALVDARRLSRVQPLIEAEATRRGLQPDSDQSNSRFPDRKLPFLPFLRQLPVLLADGERRVATPNPAPLPLKDIAAMIDDLQNVDARQWGQPGGVSLAGDPRIQALVKQGDGIVEPLLQTLENDNRLTRSVSFGRDFHRDRHLISVAEAASAALEDFLHVDFKSYGENGEPFSRKQFAAQIRTYWAKMGALSHAERFYKTLQDPDAGKDQWLQAAANIVQPIDVESHGGWVSMPERKPGQKIQLRGEKLRDGRAPSVSLLLAKRSDDIAAIRTHSSDDSFLFLNASQIALDLAAWDKAAAIPVLRRRLTRAWNIGAKPDDILAFNGNPAERFGTMIAKMTLARARCGDLSAYDEYAAWIQKAQLKGVSFGNDELQMPLIEGAARPSIGRAIAFLFNDPKSPWSNVLADGNGFWIMDFWKTPLANTQGFRKQAMRALSDKSFAGSITFNPRAEWNSRMEAGISLKGMSMGFNGSNNDPDTPPPGQKRSFRVCDVYTYFYARHQHGPKFQLFWPEKKRDAGVLACRKWLEEKGRRPQQ